MALDWLDMRFNESQVMFSMCNLLETGFLWCQLLNFELLRKSFSQYETPDMDIESSRDLYEKKVDRALFMGLAVLGTLETIVFVNQLVSEKFNLAASIFIASLSCLIGFVVLIDGAVIILKLRKLVNGEWESCTKKILLIIISILLQIILKIVLDAIILTEIKSADDRLFSEILFCLPNFEIFLPICTIYLIHLSCLREQKRQQASTDFGSVLLGRSSNAEDRPRTICTDRSSLQRSSESENCSALRDRVQKKL